MTPLLTVAEVVAVLKCSRDFVYRRLNALGAVKDGGLIRIPQEGLEAWIRNHSMSRQSAPRLGVIRQNGNGSFTAKRLREMARGGNR